jgi:hypothetical protein
VDDRVVFAARLGVRIPLVDPVDRPILGSFTPASRRCTRVLQAPVPSIDWINPIPTLRSDSATAPRIAMIQKPFDRVTQDDIDALWQSFGVPSSPFYNPVGTRKSGCWNLQPKSGSSNRNGRRSTQMEREISRLVRLQFIHLQGESQLPPFRAFESASICVHLRLFSLSTAVSRINRQASIPTCGALFHCLTHSQLMWR